MEARELSLVGQHIYAIPLREDFPYPLREGLAVRHELVLEVKKSGLGATRTHLPGGKIPNRSGSNVASETRETTR